MEAGPINVSKTNSLQAKWRSMVNEKWAGVNVATNIGEDYGSLIHQVIQQLNDLVIFFS